LLCDEQRGRKLHEKNYDGRGQWNPQLRTTEEVKGTHDTTRHEVSPIEERRYWWPEEVEKDSKIHLIQAW